MPAHEDDTANAQLNALELTQDPNQSSEEPKANSAQEASSGAFKYPYFQVYAIHVVFYYLSMHLSFRF